jgi:glucokinase
LVDDTGRVLQTARAPTSVDDLGAFMANLTALVRQFQNTARIDAIGIGVPGLHSSRTGTIETSPNIPCLDHVNLEQLLADQVHLRVISENDANAAAYAEFVCGAAVGLRNVAHLTLGTGVGSGFILNGSLYTGTSGYGGEFGHVVVQAAPYGKDTGRRCSCGKRGCLEMFVSATGIVATAEERGMQGALTSALIYEAAVRGDATALLVFQETGYYLGIGCANLINLFDLEMIIVGGGVMASGELLLNTARDTAKYCAFPASYADCQIVQSQLWPDAGIIGAAMLARDRH